MTNRSGPGTPVSTVTTPLPTMLSGGQAASPIAISSGSEAMQAAGAVVSIRAPRASRSTTRRTAGGFASGSLGFV